MRAAGLGTAPRSMLNVACVDSVSAVTCSVAAIIARAVRVTAITWIRRSGLIDRVTEKRFILKIPLIEMSGSSECGRAFYQL